MAYKDKYEIGYSEQFNITGREEKTENLNISANPISTSGSLSGTVTSGGNPVAGATVKLLDIENNPIEHANTGTDGTYSINNIPIGPYQVVAIKDGYLIPPSTPVTIQANNNATVNISIDADPEANQSAVFGMIKEANTLTPIKNAIVKLFKSVENQEDTLIGTSETNDHGQYLFTALAVGNYYVQVSKIGYVTKQSSLINVGIKQYINLDITLVIDQQANTGTIGGFIYDKTTGLPIQNAVVALYSISGDVETIVALTKTSASGRYLFANVKSGIYKVKSTSQVEGE